MTTVRIDDRALIHLAIGGVIVAMTSVAISFSPNAAGYTFVRYPIALAGVAMIGLASWRSTRYPDAEGPYLRQTLLASAPAWGRLAWFISLFGMLTALMSTTGLFLPLGLDGVPPPAKVHVLELRVMAGMALFAFTHAALMFNRNERHVNGTPNSDSNSDSNPDSNPDRDSRTDGANWG